MKRAAKDCQCQQYDGEVTRDDGLMHLACCEPLERLERLAEATRLFVAEQERGGVDHGLSQSWAGLVEALSAVNPPASPA